MNYKKLAKAADSALSDNWIKIKRGLMRTLGGDYKLSEGVTEDRIEILPEGGIIEGLTGDDIIDYVVNNFPFEFDGMHGDTFTFRLKKKVSDSATVTYKVFYPVRGKKDLEVETFEGTEEDAKSAAYDFAANFPREKVIIQKVGDNKLTFRQRADLRKMIKDAFAPGDIYNDGNVAGKVARVENDYVVVETQNEDGDVQNVEVPIEDFLDITSQTDSADLPDKPEEQFEEPDPSDIVDSFEYGDEVDIHRAAIDALTEQNITDIYDNGFTIIDVPSEVEDLDEFAKECAAEAQNMADQALGAEDQGAPEILSAVEDGQIVLYIAQ